MLRKPKFDVNETIFRACDAHEVVGSKVALKAVAKKGRAIKEPRPQPDNSLDKQRATRKSQPCLLLFYALRRCEEAASIVWGGRETRSQGDCFISATAFSCLLRIPLGE